MSDNKQQLKCEFFAGGSPAELFSQAAKWLNANNSIDILDIATNVSDES